jgi:hypothetical protein
MEEVRTRSTKRARQKEIFDQHFVLFWGDVGSTVTFRSKGRKSAIEWTVKHVEKDFEKVRWTKGGGQPAFIQLERTVILAGNKTRKETIWTCVTQLDDPRIKGKVK